MFVSIIIHTVLFYFYAILFLYKVWCEVAVGSDWVHLDPCEASVDEPLIYESWGKNQTYILSFSYTDVQDVTAKYTTRYNETLSRRLLDNVTQPFVDERLSATRVELSKIL